MVDYGMDNEEWNGRKADIDEWFEANPEYEGIRLTTDGIFGIGDGQPQLRKKHWAAICSMFAHLGEHSPVDPECGIASEDECDEDDRIDSWGDEYEGHFECDLCGDEMSRLQGLQICDDCLADEDALGGSGADPDLNNRTDWDYSNCGEGS